MPQVETTLAPGELIHGVRDSGKTLDAPARSI